MEDEDVREREKALRLKKIDLAEKEIDSKITRLDYPAPATAPQPTLEDVRRLIREEIRDARDDGGRRQEISIKDIIELIDKRTASSQTTDPKVLQELRDIRLMNEAEVRRKDLSGVMQVVDERMKGFESRLAPQQSNPSQMAHEESMVMLTKTLDTLGAAVSRVQGELSETKELLRPLGSKVLQSVGRVIERAVEDEPVRDRAHLEADIALGEGLDEAPYVPEPPPQDAPRPVRHRELG